MNMQKYTVHDFDDIYCVLQNYHEGFLYFVSRVRSVEQKLIITSIHRHRHR